MKINKVRHFFADTNSSHGYVSYADSNFGPLKNVTVLHGFPASFMERLSKRMLCRAATEDTPLEMIHNCMDNSPEGFILPEKGAGLKNVPAYREQSALCLLDKGAGRLAEENLTKAHREFAAALKIHDDWEKVYTSHMDFGTADRLAEETAERLLQGRRGTGAGRSVHRFFGAATVNGSFDYIDQLTADVSKRWFLKGRPGTGKSTFLRRIAAKAAQNDFSVEVYHCAFDPASLDMIVVRELDFCVFDSTSPHEYFPDRPEDEVIDIYKAAVEPGTDEKNHEELAAFQAAYKGQVAKATAYLREAQAHARRACDLCFATAEKEQEEAELERLEELLFR